mgnify:FL=1
MNNLFNNITNANKEKILKSLEGNTLHFKKNNTILSNIKQDNIIGIILEGYIQIVKTDYNGNRTIIEDLYDNDIFSSKMSNISNSEYSVTTKEDTKLIIIYFNEILNNDLQTPYYNQFLKNLLYIMSDKMTNINNRIEILSNKTIRNKLLAYFKLMSKKNNSRIIYLPYTFIDLADYLGVDRSAMYRELKNLKEEGLITITNKKIILNFYEEQFI